VPAAFLRNYAGLSPDVKALLDAFPMPNMPDTCSPTAAALPVREGLVNPCPAGQNPTGAGQFIKNGSNERNLDAFSFRIDHHFSDRWNMFGRVNLAPSEAVSHGLGRKGVNETNFTTVTFGLNGVLSENVANELRVNWSRSEGSANTLPSSLDGEMPPDANSLLPSFAPENSFVTYTLPASVGYQLGVQADNLQRQINIVDNVSITKGSHSFKFGFDYRRMNPSYGPQEYTLNFTIGSIANLLNGIANTATMTSRDTVPILIENYSAYAQDTWRPTRRLTLDLGVRWDVNPPPKGTGDTPLHTLTGLGPIAELDTLPPSTLEFAAPGTPLYPTRYDAIAPRFGFAYQLRNKAGSETVVRGGYGIYYDLGIGIATNAAFQFPYLRTRQATNTPYPFSDAAVAAPDPLSLNPPFRNQEFTVIDPDYVLPRSHQWTLTLAQSFGSKYTLTASYVGNAGRRLLRRYSHGFSTSTALNPEFPGARLNITTNSSENSDYSDYKALQVQFNRRLSNGFQFLTNYTWAHATDTGSDGTFANFVKNGGDPEADLGDSDFDRRHVFNASMSYDLPRLKYGNGIVRALLNGWTTDLIFKYQSAAPLSVTYVRNVPGASGFYPYRADVVPGVDTWITDETAPGGKRLNPAAFVVGADILGNPNNVIRQGTATRNSIRGFAATQLDLALGRQVTIGERVKLLLRGEMFNVLNHPNFGSPTSSLGTMFGSFFFANGTFGQSTSMLSRSFGTSTGSLSPQFQFGGPRSVQLSVKLTF
jgi:hypothetical protein